MPFPSPSVVPPTFSIFPSVSYQGPTMTITWGPAPFMMQSAASGGGLSGLDMPTMRTGDADAPRLHGQYAGLNLFSGRDITLVFDVGPPFGSYVNLSGAMAALRNALTPTLNIEYPLFVELPNGTQYAAMVRPTKNTWGLDMAYVNGQLARGVAVQFHATDPTFYAAGTLDPSVGVPAPLGGFVFPLTFPLSFGGGSNAGIINATNSGDMACYPTIVITGPCTYPTITNTSLSGNPYIQFALTMNAGDTLTINTDPKYRSVQYINSGSTTSSSRLYTLTQGSAWWGIAPMVTNIIEFTTIDLVPVAGSCQLQYSSAYSAAA